METGRFFQEWVANDLEGAPYRLEHDHGKVVLLFFWKSASVPSRKAVPYVEGLRNACLGKPLTILGVSGDHDLSRAKRWSRILNLPYNSLHDPQKAKVPNRFGVQDWPTFFVLDPKGRILASEVGFAEAKSTVLEALQAMEKSGDPIPGDSVPGDSGSGDSGSGSPPKAPVQENSVQENTAQKEPVQEKPAQKKRAQETG